MNVMKMASFAGGLMMCASAMATLSYTYENDNKTLVATVDTGTNWLQDDQYQAAMNNNTVTNLVKRGDGAFGFNGTARQFTGDARIEAGRIQLQSTNPLGTGGTVYIAAAKSLVVGSGNKNETTVIGKSIVTESAPNSDTWGGARQILVWASDITLNGKLFYGWCDTKIRAYQGAKLTFAGGVGDLPGLGKDEKGNDKGGYPYFQPSGGATFVFSGTPYRASKQFSIQPQITTSWPVDSQGFAGHFVFAVAGNEMNSLGYSNTNTLICCVEVKTTVDWAFNKSNMTMHFGQDAVWDLCGTEQRVGQFNVNGSPGNLKVAGNPSVVTNSSATPATLHMGMIYASGGDSFPNIRFGGNLSVVFDNNIYDTKIGYPMTATGDLTVRGNGTGQADLNFLSNGSWANATNVVVEGRGKIKIANPNALGRKANVNLKSNSSLEIASGVTVNVKTLTVGGVQQPRGDYTFGSGTLRVTHPCGLILSVQ